MREGWRGRFLLVAAATVVQLTIGASFASAQEVLVNGGFESGALTPWTSTNWTISTDTPHSGSYCATDDGNYFILQTFAPIPTENVTSVTFWMRQPSPGASAIYLRYSDATISSATIFPTAQWGQFDVTSYLTPGKLLTGIQIYGFTSGNPANITFLDDVSIQANLGEPIPALGSGGVALLVGLLALAGAALLRRTLA